MGMVWWGGGWVHAVRGADSKTSCTSSSPTRLDLSERGLAGNRFQAIMTESCHLNSP